MLTYADGVHVNLELGDASSVVASIETFGKVKVPPADAELLLPLMSGLDESFAEDLRLEALQRHGLVVDKDSLDDPALEGRLDAMAQKWAWQRPTGKAGQLFTRLYRASLRAHARRKIFVQDFGQTPCMPETAVRRALQTGPGQLKILCIGDDDLVSVPLAMLGHQVTVYDIDDTVLIPYLQELAAEWDLPIRAERVDLMAPQRRRGGFDVMYTDPMSTRECFDLFLSRGLAWLKRGGRAFCCVHAYAHDTFEAVQRDMGFGLRAHHHDFNHYYEEGFWENYYRSDLVELEKLPATRPVYRLDQAAPLDLTAGELDVRYHQAVDIRAIEPKHFDRAHVEAGLTELKAHRLIEVQAETSSASDTHFSYAATLAGGGSFALTAFFAEQLLAYDLYPYQPARDQAVRTSLRRSVPQTFRRMVFKAARPDDPAIGPDAPTAKRTAKRTAKKAAKKVAKKTRKKVAKKTTSKRTRR